MNKRNSVKMLAEGGMMMALAVLLSHIVLFQAPQGGSVTLGSMVPIMIFAIRWGVGPGIALGAAYGLLDFILKPYFVHWAQFALDYIIPYAMLGLVGIGHKGIYDNENNYIRIVIGAVLSIAGRMFSHILSGVIFFAEFAGDKNPWIYSTVYNASYLIPELIISVIVLIAIWKPLKRATVATIRN